MFNSSSFHWDGWSSRGWCVELAPIIHIWRGKPSLQAEYSCFLTFGSPKEKDGLLAPYLSIPKTFPKGGFSTSTHCCLASVLKLLKGTWVLENKALISSRKLVQQKLRHCQQPSGVLPTQGHSGRGFIWVQVPLLSLQLIFALCPAPKNAWLRFLGCWFCFWSLFGGTQGTRLKQVRFLCPVPTWTPGTASDVSKSYWRHFLLWHQGDTSVAVCFLAISSLNDAIWHYIIGIRFLGLL